MHIVYLTNNRTIISLTRVNDADLILNSVKGKAGGQFEFKTKDGLSYNGLSLITEKLITIHPGTHYEQWICSGGEVKCNQTLPRLNISLLSNKT